VRACRGGEVDVLGFEQGCVLVELLAVVHVCTAYCGLFAFLESGDITLF